MMNGQGEMIVCSGKIIITIKIIIVLFLKKLVNGHIHL